MKLSKAQIESMQEDMLADMLAVLIERKSLSMKDAMLLIYNSDTFARLQDTESGLYYQSVGYVMDCLENEMTTGRCE